MKQSKANELITKITTTVEKKGIAADTIIPMLQELRGHALQEQDPLVTRSIRLAYEHLENNDGWEFQTLTEDEGEEASDSPEENFLYLVTLWERSENKINRDEIRTIANNMTAES